MAKNDGFSLIEMAVVLVVVTLVMGGVIQYLNAQLTTARSARINADFNAIVSAAIGYAYNHKVLQQDGSAVVVTYALAGNVAQLNLPAQMAIDPWSHPYVYKNPQPAISWASAVDVAFTLSSSGEDGASGNTDDINRDVYAFELLSQIK